MNQDLIRTLAANNVFVFGSPAQIKLGFGAPARPMTLEPSVQLREGTYEIDEIGAYSYMGGRGSVFRHIAKVGRFCSIAGAIHTGAMEHPTNFMSTHPMFYGDWSPQFPELKEFYAKNGGNMRKAGKAYQSNTLAKAGRIEIGNDVWIGEGVFIRRGVKIGDGAIIASHSVVVKDVEPYSIVGGVSAKFIRLRFPVKIVAKLMDLKWWDYGLSAVAGVDFENIEKAVVQIEENIASGRAQRYLPEKICINPDGSVTKV
jgi:acetyltransferase-like isoleucine patch superfamily enzyme